MKRPTHRTTSVATARPLIVALLSLALISASADISRAAQIIPSIGYTKAVDANGEDGKFFGGLALRVPLLPFLSAEGGIAYREDSFSNNDLKIRMWPVTASLWLTPVPVLYAGGGLGWYRVTYDYRNALGFEDLTTDKVGVHLGGGVAIPVTPALGLDLNGRYIFMQKEDSLEFPTEFNPDFWTASVGLAIKF